MAVKKEQIIVRLSSEKKKQLQEIADDLKIDMSKLIRDKIDEIIIENIRYKGNKKVVDEYDEFIKDKASILRSQIITDDVLQETKEEFKKMLINKMKKEIEEISIRDMLNDK